MTSLATLGATGLIAAGTALGMQRRKIVAHLAGAVLAVRAVLPAARVWVGVGCDGWARNVATGSLSVARVVERFVATAQRAADVGAELIVWNAEAAYKDRRVVASGLARAIVTACAERFPALSQGHTAYDHPGYHTGYDWRGWIGPGSPVVIALPQVYAAGDTEAAGYVPHVPGRLPGREAHALRSWTAMVRAGAIKPDLVPDTPDDLDVFPYLQGHHVAATDTARALVEHELASLWAAPTRTDAQGEDALVAACAIRRLVNWGPGAVRRFQQRAEFEDLPDLVDGQGGDDGAAVALSPFLAALALETGKDHNQNRILVVKTSLTSAVLTNNVYRPLYFRFQTPY